MKFEQMSGYTGRGFEREVLATIRCGWEGSDWVKKEKDEKNVVLMKWIEDNIPDITEREWRKSSPEERRAVLLEWAKNHQPEKWDPSNPILLRENTDRGENLVDNKIAANLHAFVADALGLENYDDLKFYTTLETPADTLYGIDGYFEYKGQTFSIDLTMNQSKAEYGLNLDKADYVVTLKDPGDEAEQEEVGKRIARAFKLKMDIAAKRQKSQAA
jgi:hypothetical protein